MNKYTNIHIFCIEYNAQMIRVISEGDNPTKKEEKEKLQNNHIYWNTCEVIYTQKKFRRNRRKMICNKAYVTKNERNLTRDIIFFFFDRLDRRERKTKRKTKNKGREKMK